MNICEKCGADLKECSDCDLSNNKIIVIPENATNGDMIKAIFPEFGWDVDYADREIFAEIPYDVPTRIYRRKIYFDIQWWNAPYKKEK